MSSAVGLGIICTRPIPRGTITWVQDPLDQVIPLDSAHLDSPLFGPALERYGYADGLGNLVLCWDKARYMNHHCEPAVRGVGCCADVAVRDLEAGEELSCDYGELCPSQPMRCACGSPACRGVVRPGDAERLGASWSEQSEAALALAHRVPQPLAELLGPLGRQDPATAARSLRF